MILKADKSQDLASWRPRGGNGTIPGWRPIGLWLRKSWCLNSSLKGRKEPMPSSKVIRQEELFCMQEMFSLFVLLSLHLIGWGPPTLGRAICFTQSTDFNVNLIQKCPYRNTQDNLWLKSWALWSPVQLTHKVNHHREPWVEGAVAEKAHEK